MRLVLEVLIDLLETGGAGGANVAEGVEEVIGLIFFLAEKSPTEGLDLFFWKADLMDSKVGLIAAKSKRS